MRGLSSGSHVLPIARPQNVGVSLWKLLVAAALLVPPTAYVAGVLSSAADEPITREALLLPGASAEAEPRVVLTRVPKAPDDDGPQPPDAAPVSTPAPPPPPPPRGDCDDDDDDDGVDVIRPCPDDVDDDDDRDDDDWDDDDDDRDDDDDDGDDDGDDD